MDRRTVLGGLSADVRASAMGQARGCAAHARDARSCRRVWETKGVMEYIILIVVLAVARSSAAWGAPSCCARVGRARRTRTAGPAPEATAVAATETQAPGRGVGRRGTGDHGGRRRRPGAAGSAADSPAIEKPPPSAGRMVRLRARLARSQTGLGRGAAEPALPGPAGRRHLGRDRGDPDHGRPRRRSRPADRRGAAHQGEGRGHPDPDEVRPMLRDELLGPGRDAGHGPVPCTPRAHGGPPGGRARGRRQRHRQDHDHAASSPASWSGTGSTVLLGAADTFRAAAADQLADLGRPGRRRRRSVGPEGADPASVAFEAVKRGHRATRSTWCSSTPPAACTPRPA